MGYVVRSSLSLLVLLVAVPSAYAAKCNDTSGFAAAMESVEAAVPCASATKHGKYVKQAKKAAKNTGLSKACRKTFIKRYIKQSTCGRSNFEVCCEVNKKGKDKSNAVKAGKCKKGTVCTETNPQSVGEGCTDSGTCVTTTTTTTTTTPTTTTTTTPTAVCGDGTINQPSEECDPPGSRPCVSSPSGAILCTDDCKLNATDCPDVMRGTLDFTNSAPLGNCGETRDAGGMVLKTLTCGGLNIGGGGSVVSEGPTPDGAINRFNALCIGSDCTLSATSAAPAPSSPDPDCTTTDCNFGTPLPILNVSIPTLSTCVLNTYSKPSNGKLDLSTGVATLNVALNSATYLTGPGFVGGGELCPTCSASGSPGSPGSGTCNSGDRMGQPCTSTNSSGLTRDCPPAMGDQIGIIPVDLSPLSTGTVVKTKDDGLLCSPDLPQTSFEVGCFGSKDCRLITETGAPAGAVTEGVPSDVTLASVFCIPATGNGAIDGSANLPGPGAVSLPGTFLFTPAAP
jgi:hypothetical protein